MSPEAQREYNRRYYAANKAKLDARTKAWRKAHPEKRKATVAKYYQANKHAVNEAAARWCRENPERAREASLSWKRANRDKLSAAWHKRRSAGALTGAQVAEIKRICDGVCAYCFKPAKTLDHVLPVKRGGLSEPDNMVLACGRCNSSKNSRTPLEFVFKLPRLGV